MSTQSAGLWRNTDFVKLWSAQTISGLGSAVSFLALPLIAASLLNATSFQMGVLAAVRTLPALLLGLFAGVWVDRHRRRPHSDCNQYWASRATDYGFWGRRAKRTAD